ncbi:MAG TPA: hypothetical protein VFD36_29355 [Kofleriaceae bacterium]|nr:hypothetical protein [Kofleriaceae bacterium]
MGAGQGGALVIVDDKGFVTVRATVVPFRPQQGHPLAYDCAEGQGRLVVDNRDMSKLKPYDCVTVRFHPQDQFARLVEGGGALPWEQAS